MIGVPPEAAALLKRYFPAWSRISDGREIGFATKRRLTAAALGLHLASEADGRAFVDEYVSVPGREIPIRIYGIDHPGDQPTIIYFHGGGWVSGNLDSHHALCCLLQKEMSARLVSVHTRRAPESPWPAQREDALDVIRHLQLANGLVDIAANGLILAGDSAGAFTAFHAALALAETAIIRGVLLFYPALDPDIGKASYQQYADAPGLSAENMRQYWAALFAGDKEMRAACHLANIPDLASLPPVCMLIAEHDPLRNDPALLADLLAAHGRAVLQYLAPDTTHGFCRFVGRDGAARQCVEAFLEQIPAFLRQAGQASKRP